MIVQGTALQIKEYRGKRVVTFKDIDIVHKRPDGTASRNFRENRQRFISGVDFYSVEITNDEFRRQFGISKNAGRTITLITETGYLMLVKSFTDDLAWKVQRELVKMQRIPNVLPIFKTTRIANDFKETLSLLGFQCNVIFKITQMLKNDLEFRVSLTRASVGTYKGVM